MNQEIIYKATKTATQFHLSNSFVRLLLGAVGCGKSVANCAEVFRRAMEQDPANDGIRYSRWAIVRNTYPELKSTTIKTWLDWFPEKVFGKIKWDSPITHKIIVNDINLEVIFLSLDTDIDEQKLMSLELTGIYFNELQYISYRIFKLARKRVNRYPAKKSGAKITWAGVIADTNPPDTDHWIYKLFEEKKPENHEIFKYMPAVIQIQKYNTNDIVAKSLSGKIYKNNSEADFIKNLNSTDYYLKDIPGSTDEEIKVLMQGEYGITIDGKPVYPEYNDAIHFSESIRYLSSYQIGLGWDFGLTPSVVITQFIQGRLLALDELTSQDMGIEQFASDIVLPYLNSEFRGWKNNYVSFADPAGNTPAQTNEKTCLMVLGELGIVTSSATTNYFIPRRESVSFFLRKLINGKGAFLLSQKCKVLRRGFLGQYQYRRIKITNKEEGYKDEPLKNYVSHPHDALQYIALYYKSMYDNISGGKKIELTGENVY